MLNIDRVNCNGRMPNWSCRYRFRQTDVKTDFKFNREANRTGKNVGARTKWFVGLTWKRKILIQGWIWFVWKPLVQVWVGNADDHLQLSFHPRACRQESTSTCADLPTPFPQFDGWCQHSRLPESPSGEFLPFSNHEFPFYGTDDFDRRRILWAQLWLVAFRPIIKWHRKTISLQHGVQSWSCNQVFTDQEKQYRKSK